MQHLQIYETPRQQGVTVAFPEKDSPQCPSRAKALYMLLKAISKKIVTPSGGLWVKLRAFCAKLVELTRVGARTTPRGCGTQRGRSFRLRRVHWDPVNNLFQETFDHSQSLADAHDVTIITPVSHVTSPCSNETNETTDRVCCLAASTSHTAIKYRNIGDYKQQTYEGKKVEIRCELLHRDLFTICTLLLLARFRELTNSRDQSLAYHIEL